MKKILLSTIVLLSFSLSILLFQVSCKKEAKAESPVTTSINTLVFTKRLTNSTREIWTANYDGSNQKKVNVQLPIGIAFFEDVSPKLSPDGKVIFFNAGKSMPGDYIDGVDIYVCNVDGSNVKKVVSHGDAIGVYLNDLK